MAEIQPLVVPVIGFAVFLTELLPANRALTISLLAAAVA